MEEGRGGWERGRRVEEEGSRSGRRMGVGGGRRKEEGDGVGG